jgi:predicted DNA-binding transcriptional regulator AlpA
MTGHPLASRLRYEEIPISDDGFRYEDLETNKVVRDRTDLHRKQQRLNFPKPLKLSDRYAWYPGSWVRAWLQERAAMQAAQQAAEAAVPDALKPRLMGGE